MMRYADLLKRRDAPAGSSWGLFGPDDELGTINFITPERVAAAARLVRRGAVFNLDCPINAFQPPVARHRKPAQHAIFANSPHHRDDYVDRFYLQSSSQIDGLRHFRHPAHGFYNHAPDAEIAVGSPRIGINRWAERGIVGRAVVIDIERHLAKGGERLDYDSGQAFDTKLVDEAAAAQGVRFKPGDILLLRTGWMAYYFKDIGPVEREALPGNLRSPGLAQSHETLAWIWDNQFALCASDNVALESFPPGPDSPFGSEVGHLPGVHPMHAGMMHPYMIALLGLAVGELWWLDDLAADCARDGVWECMLTAKPLNLVGGVGSPANALAIK